MAEPVRAAVPKLPQEPRDPEAPAIDPADFPGCQAVHIPREEIEDYDGRLEYWEAHTETAMVVCEPTTRYHERPSHRLGWLAGRIAASRGTLIEMEGTTDLVRFDTCGERKVLMQADQILYLHPPAAELNPSVNVDGDVMPDVVLEVDYSTDVRVRKLALYEAWGFPEVWVDVPDAPSRSRPKSRRSGLTIHVLEAGRFRTAPSSRAFPGWTAEEIHTALNEPVTSPETMAVLHRVGRALGAAEGTGPDDDVWLRTERDESRVEGRAEGRVEGRAEGRAEGHADVLRAVHGILEARGIPTTPALAVQLAELTDGSVAELIRAAQTCANEAEFLRLLRRR